MKTFPENINPDLLIAFLCGETSPEDAQLVKEWIMASDDNHAIFENLKKIWNTSENAFSKPINVDKKKAWSKLNNRIENTENKKTDKKAGSKFISFTLKVAAVLVPFLLISYYIFNYYYKNELLTINSEDKTLEKNLPDGTIVKLNSHSILQYPAKFDTKSREISFIGEGFFNVSPDKHKPFVIHCDKIYIKVLGTSFNVNAVPGKKFIKVYVKSGKVLLYNLNIDGLTKDSIILSAGNTGTYNNLNNSFEKDSITGINDLFWINKALAFKNTRLETVFEILRKKYNVKIIIEDKNINDLTLTSTFEDQPIENILKIIAESFKLKISKIDSTYKINVE